MRAVKLLALASLFVIAACADVPAQPEHITMLQDSAYTVGFAMNPENGGAVDSLLVTLQTGGEYYWIFPRPVREGEVDSVGLWLEIDDSSEVKILSAFNPNNRTVLGSVQGPAPYGYYTFPFHVEPGLGTSTWLVAAARSTKQFLVGFTKLDAACMLTKGVLHVPESPNNQKRPSEFIDVLGRPHAPSDVYRVLSDGRGLVLR